MEAQASRGMFRTWAAAAAQVAARVTAARAALTRVALTRVALARAALARVVTARVVTRAVAAARSTAARSSSAAARAAAARSAAAQPPVALARAQRWRRGSGRAGGIRPKDSGASGEANGGASGGRGQVSGFESSPGFEHTGREVDKSPHRRSLSRAERARWFGRVRMYRDSATCGGMIS